jgi:hypothetical protein
MATKNGNPPSVDLREYVMTSAALASSVVAWLDEVTSDDYRLVTFDHRALDRDVAIYPGSLTGILGRPSHGKSMVCKWLAKRECSRILAAGVADQECVVYVTLEESPQVIAMALSGWRECIQDVVRGQFDHADAELRAVRMVKLPLFVLRHPGLVHGRVAPAMTPERLYCAIETIVADYPADEKKPRIRPTLVVLDYIQLLQGDSLAMTDRTKTAQVTAAIEGAKNLAVRLGVPVVMAVQAGRGTDVHVDCMPRMADAQWACLGGATTVMLGDSTWETLSRLHQRHNAGESLWVAGLVGERVVPLRLEASIENPPRPCWRIEVAGGVSLIATANHPLHLRSAGGRRAQLRGQRPGRPQQRHRAGLRRGAGRASPDPPRRAG